MSKDLEIIANRCKKQGLEPQYYDNSDLSDEVYEYKGLIVKIQEERTKKEILIPDNEEIEEVKNSQFEKYKFIKGYEAIWSSELGAVECEIQSDDQIRSGRLLIRRLKRIFRNQNSEESSSSSVSSSNDEGYYYEFPSPYDDIHIKIGYSTIEFSILSSYKKDSFYMPDRIRQKPTIRIEGLKISKHKEAKAILTKMSNSVFFQIDLKVNLPLHLTLDRELFREIRNRRKIKRGKNKFKSPQHEYDQETMSLYWYARTANNMPLLQYLTFYQILEFYFPQYSHLEAQRHIKNILKDPEFDSNRDNDITKILNVLKSSGRGNINRDEKNQLKDTIFHCVDKTTMYNYLTEIEERKAFFDNQEKNKGLAKQQISLSKPEHDTREDVASRIYEIRCRIVHTKNEKELERLLPFSPEINKLKHDIGLIEFIAQKAIIAGGRQFTIYE